MLTGEIPRSVTLPAPSDTLELSVAGSGWTRVRLVGTEERLLGAEDFFNLTSRLMAALSDPWSPTQEVHGVDASLVVRLWEDHHGIYVERRGIDARVLHILQARTDPSWIAQIELGKEDVFAWRHALVDLVAWGSARRILL